jgi:hypothetical protein
MRETAYVIRVEMVHKALLVGLGPHFLWSKALARCARHYLSAIC